MFEALRLRAGLWYSGIHFRKQIDPSLRFNDIISRARRVLVVFPESSIDWESTQMLLKYLTRRFASGSMLIVVRQELLSNVLSTPNVKTLTYVKDDVGSWFLPRRSLIKKITSSPFDLAIDLNIGLGLTSAYIVRESAAPLRIGFGKEQFDLFYNFQVQLKPNSSNPAAYRSLLKYLDMF